jgi:pimeloyl-ACP methyl ester carboxylesterase
MPQSFWTITALVLTLFCFQSCFYFRTSNKKALRSFAKKGQTVLLADLCLADGQCIHYAQVGDSKLPKLVFIHGTPGSWDNFIHFMQDSSLRRRFCMISFDRPGLGYSGFGRAKPLAYQVDALATAFATLHPETSAHWLGHSLGGPFVVEMAARHPQLCAGIGILAGSVSADLEPRERWRYAFRYAPLRWLLPGAFRPSNQELVYFKKEVLAQDSLLCRVQCPAIIVHGTKDSFVPYGNATYALERLASKQKQLITIPKGNHFIIWNRYVQILEAIDWLEKERKW